MNIVFFGSPDFANPSLIALNNSKHNVLSVVTNIDKPFGRGRKLEPTDVKSKAIELDIPVIEVDSLNNNIDIINILTEINADLFIVVAFRILPKMIFNIPKFGTINLHGSLLPKYRGAAPIQRAIMNGDSQSGLTTFFINEKVDTGKILMQKNVDILPNDTTGDLWESMSNIGANLLVETVNKIASKEIAPIKQNLSEATKAPKLTKNDSIINWNNSAEMIHNQIRALSPKPGAYSFLNDKRVKCYSSEVVDYSEHKLNPFQYIKTKNCIYAGTGNGILRINEIQLEGKKRMKVVNYSSEQNKEIINEFQKK